MKNRRRQIFFGLEIKKGLLLIPSFFLILAVTAGVLVLASAIYCAAMKQEHVLPKLSVAVVSPDRDEMTMSAADLIREMESVKSVARISVMEKEEAERRFSRGSVQAILYLPEGMYESIDSGENLPVTVRINNDSGLASELFRELIQSGTSLIQTSESSIYAMAQVSLKYPLRRSAQDLMNAMAVSYIGAVMNRGNVWNETMLSAYGNMTEQKYYALSVLLVSALMFGTAFAVFYSGGEASCGKMLTRNGVGPAAQSAAKISAMTLVLWILFVGWYFSLYVAGFAEFRPVSAVMLVAAAFSIAGFVHLIYSFVQGESSVFFYAVISIALFLLSGGIVPKTMFPDWLAGISQVLPSGFWENYLAGLIYGDNGNPFSGMAATMAGLILYGLAMAAAGNWRWKYAEK